MRDIALTLGDPGGIGPEIALRALEQNPAFIERTVLFGSDRVLREVCEHLRFRLPVVDFEDCNEKSGVLAFYALEKRIPFIAELKFEKGRISANNGLISMKTLEAACDWVEEGLRNGCRRGLVTLPISKMAWRLAGYLFPGHTEFLQFRTGARNCEMLFRGGGKLIALATRHVPFQRVVEHLTSERLTSSLEALVEAMVSLGIRRPRLAVAGLNPHAGEAGLIGTEEEKIITPVIEKARKEFAQKGLEFSLVGPCPADTLFHELFMRDLYDGVLALYHDQALAPFKLLHFNDGVNLTWGLPFPRTSPDHGTAFDIAWQGKAQEGSLIEAMKLAAALLDAEYR